MKQHAITGRSGYRRGLAGPGGDLLEQGGGSLQPLGRLAALPGVSGGGAGQVAGPGLGLAFAGPGQLGVAPGSVPVSSSRVRA
jgi:hypothetical protein